MCVCGGVGVERGELEGAFKSQVSYTCMFIFQI